MKRSAILACLMLSISTIGMAQKKPLDHSVYDSWQSIKRVQITENGKYAVYLVNPQEGDAILHIDQMGTKKKASIDRVEQFQITPNEKFFIGTLVPKYALTKAHKIKKGKPADAPKDTLLIASLPINKIDTIGGIKSFKKGVEGNTFFAYQPLDTVKTRKKDAGWFKNPLVIREFGSNWNDTINYVDNYTFSKNGNQLLVTIIPNKKDSIQKEKQIIFYDLDKKSKQVISKGYKTYKTPIFDTDGKQVALLASKDSVVPTNRHYELLLYKLGNDSCKTLIGTDYSGELPQNWYFTENSSVSFSNDGSKLFTSIAPLTLPADTVKILEETAKLDLWHYKDPYTQPAQLKSRTRDAKQTYAAVINLSNPHKLIPLIRENFEYIDRVNRGDNGYAILTNNAEHIIESQWLGTTPKDVYKVDYTTGKRELLLKGFLGMIQTSPNGKYLLAYNLEDLNWYALNIETKNQVNLTKDLDINFWDESSDTPGEPYPYGSMGWFKDDTFVYIYDAFDVWKFDPTGKSKPISTTKGEGRKQNKSYRYISTDSEKRFFEDKDQLLMSVFDKTTKDAGLATLSINKIEEPKLVRKMEPTTYNTIVKSKNKPSYLFIKSNFIDCPDVYYTNNWSKAEQLSHINPQKADYNWGTAELFKWHAYDGDKMEGILYKPEDFDPNKKYPVMIYFYETHSDNLNAHHMPQPSWSIINISFYVSRGYIVFTPDTHYKTGLPGESAYNCIVSGAEALAKNSWVDSENMAIQGQSWGGYQVAYLVTRTNMFKAAGSGAPVSNMTSAYGGIRWGTGNSRQVQYEKGQSRIGATLWEQPELYILNSPLFRVDRIETPLLIMHNDNDGAVPWYQGIEMYMAMRRLQKPVWMLQYNNEEHNLIKRVNRKDLSIRLQQFFDHYLKGEPAPEWLESGIPAVRKGKTWGTDLVQ